ncbi:MAG: hypothetical protein SH820_08390 [Xanthomonadales bacterium]|nr:hypothetical protein [Xanthomonadales bacterium]
MIKRGDRKNWAREQFQGFENILMPSFSANYRELNEEGIRLDVRQSIAHGFFATLCAMESGMTPTEQRRLLEIACDEAGDDIHIGMSLAGESLEQDVAQLQFAESVGVSHAQITWPQNFRPSSHDEVVEFASALSQASHLGLVLLASENFAMRHLHPSGLPFEAFERLADLDNVIALQLGSMDAGLILECCERFCDRLLVTSMNFGMLPMLVQNFDLQWSGAWCVEALQSPEKPYANQFLDALRKGEMDTAMGIYWNLFPALAAMGRTLAANKRFLEIVCDEAADKIQVSFTLLFDSFEDTLEMLEHAEKVGASHALLAYPQDFRPTCTGRHRRHDTPHIRGNQSGPGHVRHRQVRFRALSPQPCTFRRLRSDCRSAEHRVHQGGFRRPGHDLRVF